MKALIHQGRIEQIEGEAFPVAAPLYWVDAPDDAEVGWHYDGTVFAPPPTDTGTVTWPAIRRERDDRLIASDWTQLPDADLGDAERQAWRSYRKALRDITDAFDDPAAVVWPDPPK
ncbi:tail fiber assembly protein [Fodinicurvata sp. EGI_FJ10296]|uniref:tail fiber assembly protein n=1 Tax=Fodinicurvata sp. EGI_FJ10296 TaxID=3231908 RepID=UPI003455F808